MCVVHSRLEEKMGTLSITGVHLFSFKVVNACRRNTHNRKKKKIVAGQGFTLMPAYKRFLFFCCGMCRHERERSKIAPSTLSLLWSELNLIRSLSQNECRGWVPSALRLQLTKNRDWVCLMARLRHSISLFCVFRRRAHFSKWKMRLKSGMKCEVAVNSRL